MSDPRYRIDRPVGAPPETVLAALRDAAAATPRGALPPAQQRGVRGLRCTVRGRRFTVGMDETGEGDDAGLHGWVLPEGGTSSRVQASVQEDRSAGASVLGVLVFAVVYSLTGGEGGWMIVIFALLLGVIPAIRNAAGMMNHDRAAFLVQWLNGVLDALPPASSFQDVPPPSADAA